MIALSNEHNPHHRSIVGNRSAFARKLATREAECSSRRAALKTSLFALCNELGPPDQHPRAVYCTRSAQPDGRLQLFEETKKRELEIDTLINNAGGHRRRADGRNINLECGSTHPEGMARTVRVAFAFGVAFDGDGDRAIPVDDRAAWSMAMR